MRDDRELRTHHTIPSSQEPLNHQLSRYLPELVRFRSRAALYRSRLFRELVEPVREVTHGIEYGTFATVPPPRKFLRVAAWNLERGKRLDAIIAYLHEHPALQHADVLLLNEVDIGMARSGNHNVARQMAERLGYDYVFGNSYLCLDQGNVRDGSSKTQNRLGLHGNAILSRHPFLEAANFSIAITKDKFESTERRLGHKKALWAKLETPLGPLLVCTVHLDSRASPEQRGEQMADVVEQLAAQKSESPTIVGGDWNTTTYDTKSLSRLLWSLAKKVKRGGFPHAIHHYTHPELLYEQPVFNAIRQGKLHVQEFNAAAVGTTRYEVGDRDAESQVSDHLPRLAVELLRWKLKPWNGVVPLKLDWFAARGVRALGDGELRETMRRSMAPCVLERPEHAGQRLSDHDPIVLDVVPSSR